MRFAPGASAVLAAVLTIAVVAVTPGCSKPGDAGKVAAPASAAAPTAPLDPACGAALDAVFTGADRLRPGVYLTADDDAARVGLGDAWRPLLDGVASAGAPAGAVAVRYPVAGALFPADISAPIFRFTDPAPADRWAIDLSLGGGAAHVRVVTAGFAPARPVDTRLNIPGAASAPPDEPAPARGWRPSAALWDAVKRCATGRPATFTVTGFTAGATPKPLTRGEVPFSVSPDPVDAPVFFRAVPLPFKFALKNVDKIQWLLGDLRSEKPASVVMENIPVCANCHSFSHDGKTLALDVDYANDKGSYAVTDIAPETVLDRQKIISWSDYKKDDGQPTFGLLSQISPDGRYVVSTVKDMSVFIPAPDLMYSQLFFPIRGILAVYDRQTKTITALPGADDPKFVQSNPTWSPDGQSIVFARAPALEVAKPANPQMAVVNREDLPKVLGGGAVGSANSPLTYDKFGAMMEGGRKFRYDLYRIPFNGGKGGQAVPIAGASENGRSNYFAKFSPDGKFIVFCQNDSFMLLRFDSALYIMPAEGGTPRRLDANFEGHMNSWHSFSPNGKWLVYSSKVNGPFTQLWLTHLDAEGRDSPPVLLENFTPANRAANIPEFVNRPLGQNWTVTEAFADAYSYFRQGFQDFELSDNELAVRELSRAEHLTPDDAQTQKYLGAALARLGKTDEAMPHFERAKALAPKDATLRRMMATALGGQGKLDEALTELRAAAKAAPKDAAVQGELGRLLLEAGKAGEALPALQAAAQADPADVALALLVAKAQERLGQFAVSAAAVEAVLKLKPTEPHALTQLGWLRAAAPDDAVRNGARAVEIAEGLCNANRFRVPEELDLLGAAYAEAGRFDDAIKQTEDAAHRVTAEVAAPMTARAALYHDKKPFRLTRGGR